MIVSRAVRRSPPARTASCRPRARWPWIARATSSLPVPLSPLHEHVALVVVQAVRSCDCSARMGGALPDQRRSRRRGSRSSSSSSRLRCTKRPALERLAHTMVLHAIDVTEGLGQVVEGAAADAAHGALDAGVAQSSRSLRPRAARLLAGDPAARDRWVGPNNRSSRTTARSEVVGLASASAVRSPPTAAMDGAGGLRLSRMRRRDRSSSGSSSTSSTRPGTAVMRAARSSGRVTEGHASHGQAHVSGDDRSP